MHRSAIVAGIAGLSACAAVAQADTLFGSAGITQSGQVFVFNFSNVGQSVGAGTITVEALGDYSIVPPSSETMTWDVDGIATDIGFNADAFTGDIDLFQNHVLQSWTISAADMAAITADGSVTITLTNSGTVNFYSDQDDWISVTLDYPVPAPGAAALLGMGALTLTRRRR